MKQIFLLLFCFVSLCGNAKNDFILVDICKVLNSLETRNLSISQLNFDLPLCIYLDYSLKKRVDRIDSSYLSGRVHYQFEFTEKEKDKGIVYLCKKYKHIEDLIIQVDDSLSKYFKIKYGIDVCKSEDTLLILKYKNKVFIGSSWYAFIVEMIDTKKIQVELIHILID